MRAPRSSTSTRARRTARRRRISSASGPSSRRFAPAGCEAILNLSTGSSGGRVSGEPKRWECLELEPELASFDCGSLNFGEWLFENPLPFLRDMARAFRARGVKPEIECFDVGHVQTALRLRDEGLLDDPLHFQFVLGVRGGAPGHGRERPRSCAR